MVQENGEYASVIWTYETHLAMDNAQGDPKTLRRLILDNNSGLMEQFPDRSLNAAAAARHDMDNILNITWPQQRH